MACINRISTDRLFSCGAPPTPALGSPVKAYLINASDIVSYTTNGGVATVTLVTGVKGTAIEAGNNSLVVNVSLKGGEVYPQQHDVSIEATLFGLHNINDDSGRTISGGANSQTVFAIDHGSGVYKIYGLGAPLEVLSSEGSTTGNGYMRTTFGVEDWQTGTTIYSLTKAAFDALSTPAPAPAPAP